MQDHDNEEPLRPPHQEHPTNAGPPEQTPAAQRRLTPHKRLRQFAALAPAVAVLLAVVTVTASPSAPSPRARTDHAITSLLAGIPQRGTTLGRSTAPVTLIWYGDLECPFCKQFALGALPPLITRWVRDGQLKIDYRSMETATRDPKIFLTQQVAALAAGTQNKMWNYIETFYHEQGQEDTSYVTEHYLRALATQVPGLNLTPWQENRNDQQLANKATEEQHDARRAHYLGTPTFLIGQSNGAMYRLTPRSLTNPTLFNAAIEYLLRM
jgi:protein-disulfide isomerase